MARLSLLVVLPVAVVGFVFHQKNLLFLPNSQRKDGSTHNRAIVMQNAIPKTVSETIRAFESAYPKPVVTAWRSPVNDMLQVTHLSVVDSRFKYDAIFGFGYEWIFQLLMAKYPVKSEVEAIVEATISALDLSVEQISQDAKDVANWLEGKSEADILTAPEQKSNGKVEAALASIKENENYLHTRCGNLGVLAMMDAVGVKPEGDALTRWADALGMRKRSLEKDAVLLREFQEKMTAALQMIKSLEIREKKTSCRFS
mmetsp:Transcript_11339/g.13941  ORF Transcript_11339/g.13941 Transcript_11339/m.13941 type:complete len:257 (-) Transcript_11339:1312-2082(-)